MSPKQKGSRKNKGKEIEPSSQKQYELNVYHKRSAKLSHDIYKLPLDLKLIIFGLAMNSHMVKWQKCHKTSTRAWYGIKTRYKPFSWLDLIKGWGSQAPKTKFFPHVPDRDTGDLRGAIPDEYKVKLCSDKNVIVEKDGVRYLNYKVTIVVLRRGDDPARVLAPHNFSPVWEQDHAHEIRSRSVTTDNSYWFHDRCRCLTCDLIRVYAVDAGCESIRNLSVNSRDKYRNIDYMGNGQWKTHKRIPVTLTNKGRKLLRKS